MSVDFGPLRPADASSGVARSSQEQGSAPAEKVAEAMAPLQDAADAERHSSALLERLTKNGPQNASRLSIDRDDVTGDFVYRFLDARTGEVMRQFPAEEMLELLRFLGEQPGLVVDQRV
jgi:flagellar protein FlaG